MYSRKLNGRVYTFGVSGKLWRNALVMYDHQTGSYWSHFTGESIWGPMKGESLRMLTSVPRAKWKKWREEHSETLVLSVEGREDVWEDAYAEYHHSSRTGLFDTEQSDRRLWVKDMVVGVVVADSVKAYPFKAFKKTSLLQEEFAGVPLLVFHDKADLASAVYDRRTQDGALLSFPEKQKTHLVQDESGRTWNLLTGQAGDGSQLRQLIHLDVYWFAWVDYYPHTELYKPD